MCFYKKLVAMVIEEMIVTREENTSVTILMTDWNVASTARM